MATTATLGEINNIKQIKRAINKNGFKTYQAILTSGEILPLSVELWDSIKINFCIKMSKSFVTWKYTGGDSGDTYFTIKSTYGAKFNGTPKTENFKSVMQNITDTQKHAAIYGAIADYAVGQTIPQNLKDSFVEDIDYSVHKSVETFGIVNHVNVSKIKAPWKSTRVYASEFGDLEQRSKPGNPNSWTDPADVWQISSPSEITESERFEIEYIAKTSAIGDQIKWKMQPIDGTLTKNDFNSKQLWGTALIGDGERKIGFIIKADALMEEPEKFTLKVTHGNQVIHKKVVTINNLSNKFSASINNPNKEVIEGSSLQIKYVSPPQYTGGKPIKYVITPTGDGGAKNDFTDKKLEGFFPATGFQYVGHSAMYTIPVKKDSAEEQDETFNIELLFKGESFFSDQFTIKNVAKGVRTMTSTQSEVDEGVEFNVTLVFPEDDDATDGTEIPFVVTGVSNNDLLVDGARLNKREGVFVKGTKETILVKFDNEAQGIEGTEFAKFALKYNSTVSVDVKVNDMNNPVAPMQLAGMLVGDGTDTLSYTLSSLNGEFTEASGDYYIEIGEENPLTATAIAGGGNTTLYGNGAGAALTDGSVTATIAAGTTIQVNSTDANLTNFIIDWVNTPSALEKVPGHDTNGGWYVVDNDIWYLHKGGRSLNEAVAMIGNAKTITSDPATLSGSDKLTLILESTGAWQNLGGFDIVSPNGTVAGTITSVEYDDGSGRAAFVMEDAIDPGVYTDAGIYTIRVTLSVTDAPSVGMKMDPTKNYKIEVDSVEPGPWSDSLYSANALRSDDFDAPQPAFFTGRTTTGTFLEDVAIETRMTFDINDQAGGRAEWKYSESAGERANASGNLTTPNTHTAFANIYYNRLSEEASPLVLYISANEDDLPTHATDYNMHKLYLRFRTVTNVSKEINVSLYEVDQSGAKIGDALGTAKWENGLGVGPDGWTAASEVTWNVNTVSNTQG